MNHYKLYMHTAPDGRVYIGITQQRTDKRWRGGASQYKENIYFYQEILRLGWDNFSHEIIRDGLSRDEAERLEREYIARYDSLNPEKGFNRLLGGGHTATATAETRAKMSASHTGHPTSDATKAKLRASHLGVPLSEEHLAGIRAAAVKRRGKPLPASTREKISAALTGRVKTAEHLEHWRQSHTGFRHSEETKAKIRQSRLASEKTKRGKDNNKSQPVLCVETNTRYETVTDAAQATGANPTNISKCCHGERRTAGGYHWVRLAKEGTHEDIHDSNRRES